jgi:hypothetical protein
VETPDPYKSPQTGLHRPPPRSTLRHPEGLWAFTGTLTWLSGLVLCLSTFMSWYSGRADDSGGYALVLSVNGWHTGLVGQIVFVLGLIVLLFVALRQFGIALPASVPESLVVIGVGVLATILVLVRLIWIPDKFLPADGRAIGLWIALIAALGVIAAGLLEASEEV